MQTLRRTNRVGSVAVQARGVTAQPWGRTQTELGLHRKLLRHAGHVCSHVCGSSRHTKAERHTHYVQSSCFVPCVVGQSFFPRQHCVLKVGTGKGKVLACFVYMELQVKRDCVLRLLFENTHASLHQLLKNMHEYCTCTHLTCSN